MLINCLNAIDADGCMSATSFEHIKMVPQYTLSWWICFISSNKISGFKPIYYTYKFIIDALEPAI